MLIAALKRPTMIKN